MTITELIKQEEQAHKQVHPMLDLLPVHDMTLVNDMTGGGNGYEIIKVIGDWTLTTVKRYGDLSIQEYMHAVEAGLIK